MEQLEETLSVVGGGSWVPGYPVVGHTVLKPEDSKPDDR